MPCAAIACSISFTKGTPTVQVLTSSFMALPLAKPTAPNATSRKGGQCRQRDEDDFTTVGEVLRRRGSPRLALEQRPHRRLVDVVDHQVMPDIEQLVRHRLAHGAYAQISRFHDDRLA
jgi:hypothetical protein